MLGFHDNDNRCEECGVQRCETATLFPHVFLYCGNGSQVYAHDAVVEGGDSRDRVNVGYVCDNGSHHAVCHDVACRNDSQRCRVVGTRVDQGNETLCRVSVVRRVSNVRDSGEGGVVGTAVWFINGTYEGRYGYFGYRRFVIFRRRRVTDSHVFCYGRFSSYTVVHAFYVYVICTVSTLVNDWTNFCCAAGFSRGGARRGTFTFCFQDVRVG